MTVHDAIGVGFGPSNMAIAIALEERLQQRHPGQRARDAFNAVFLERQRTFSWHPQMLIRDADMQVSFLKDLATPRNPRSPYSFINYVHQQGRFSAFCNLKSFNPSRVEFNDYLTWAFDQLRDWASTGETVTAIDPVVESGRVTLLEVTSHTAEGERIRRRTRNLITSLGGSPRVPAAFQPALADARVFHSHHYLAGRSRNPGARRYAIIGAGQSAAEIFMDLASDEANHVDLVARAYAPRPADETPFVNRIFDEEFIDHFYQLDAAQRAAFLEAFHHTNYAAIDVDLLHAMNRRLYEDRFLHPDRLRLRMRHEVSAVVPRADHVELVLTDLNTGRQYQQAHDAVILATGYERSLHQKLLGEIRPYITDFSVDRHYRLKSVREFEPTVFVLGSNEATHGLSDTLLSVAAIRAGQIADTLLASAGQFDGPDSLPAASSASRQHHARHESEASPSL